MLTRPLGDYSVDHLRMQDGGGGRVRKSASVILTSQCLYKFRPARTLITSQCHSKDDLFTWFLTLYGPSVSGYKFFNCRKRWANTHSVQYLAVFFWEGKTKSSVSSGFRGKNYIPVTILSPINAPKSSLGVKFVRGPIGACGPCGAS